MKLFTALEAAHELDLDRSRILQLCRAGRLGQTMPKFGQAWVITSKEIAAYRAIGPILPGRPKKKL